MESCSICLEDFTLEDFQNDRVRQLKACGHSFHENCLRNWVRGEHGYGVTRTCPLCRLSVDNVPAFLTPISTGNIELSVRNVDVPAETSRV